MLKKPFWVFSGTQWVFVNTISYFKEPRRVLLNTILGFEELRGVFLKTIRYFIGPQLVLLNNILGTPRYCRTTRGFTNRQYLKSFLTFKTDKVLTWRTARRIPVKVLKRTTGTFSVPLVLNKPGFWTYQGSEYAGVPQGSDYVWILPQRTALWTNLKLSLLRSWKLTYDWKKNFRLR